MPGRHPSLNARLAVAFAAVAVGAVALLALLTLVASRTGTTTLVEARHAATADAVAAALGQAYEERGSWRAADLGPAQALAAAAPAVLEIRAADGLPVAIDSLMMANMMTRMHRIGTGPLDAGREVRVTADGVPVGTATLRFHQEPGPEARLGAALASIVVLGALLSGVVAGGLGLLVARRITRPLAALTRSVRAFERGDRTARAGASTDSGEVGRLATAFDRMADTLCYQERQRRALVADVAHELRTPLTVLEGSFEALADGVVEPSRERLGSIADEVRRLRRSVEDFEALSAADAAGLSLERKPVDLAAIARDATASLAAQVQAAELRLQEDLAPVTVTGDPSRLRQVVTNLLANAVKFTPAGGTITVRTVADGVQARLEVADTGPGIPADERPHVFERFWRGANAAGVGGSGVGLAVVAELAAAHGGDVKVGTNPAGGATFTVRLPHARRADG
ncbi:MAG: sensor histidine kinase [Egibacteraceae bacterium]